MTECQEIIELSPVAMAVTEGSAHTLMCVNAAFCELLGKTAGEMLGHSASEAISAAGGGSILALLDRIYGGEKSGTLNPLQLSDPRHKHKSYLVWGLPVVNGPTESLVIQVTDLTEQNLTHEHVERATKEIVALNREMLEISEQLVLSGLHQQTIAERNRAIAEALQYSILWQQPEKLFQGLKVAVFYEPALDDALVGGDFFDAFRLPNKSLMLVVGDVTGKGLKAASRTVEITFALRAFAQDYKNPADLITRLNEFICDFHPEDDGLGNDFVVLSLIIVDPITGAAQVASAGAEPPLVLRASGAVEEVAVQGLILGIDHDAVYETMNLHLEEGDTLLMTTDGITETRRGRDFFGSERLLETARKAGESGTLQDIGQSILDAARAHGGGQFGDDVCLLLVRRDRLALTGD